ncbi:DUF4342 domain-containing protein [Proteocatella sphenisci]|uniref:DUF4342 domain-containing protein n=1 Tax=Proteocatella sphenisci TaxID=181070 RepID=UPI0004B2EADD|nr:DUF4342 domain-containing protein [Proteocatella sphenisci]
MVTLEKIDKIVERTGVTFEEARDALNECNGDVVEAIILIQSEPGLKQEKDSKVSDIISTLKEYIRKGNVSRIIVENDGEVVLSIPVTVGVIGAVIAPVIAVIGLGATVINKVTVKVVDSDGKVTNINKVKSEKVDDLKKAGKEMSEDFKDMTDDIKAKIKVKKRAVEDKFDDIDEIFEDGSEEVELEADDELCEWREDAGTECEPEKEVKLDK